jgi:hypothetical protein
MKTTKTVIAVTYQRQEDSPPQGKIFGLRAIYVSTQEQPFKFWYDEKALRAFLAQQEQAAASPK